MGKETTSTNQGIGDEGYKGSDLSEIEKINRREPSVKGAENLIRFHTVSLGSLDKALVEPMKWTWSHE